MNKATCISTDKPENIRVGEKGSLQRGLYNVPLYNTGSLQPFPRAVRGYGRTW